MIIPRQRMFAAGGVKISTGAKLAGAGALTAAVATPLLIAGGIYHAGKNAGKAKALQNQVNNQQRPR